MNKHERRHICLSSPRLSYPFPVFLYVRPSVCLCAWRNSVPIGRIYMKYYICGFLIHFEKIQDRLKSDKITVFITWRPTDIYNNNPLNSSKNDKYFRQISREKQKALFVYLFFFRKSCIYELMCKSTVQAERPQITIQYREEKIRVALRPEDTHTYTFFFSRRHNPLWICIYSPLEDF